MPNSKLVPPVAYAKLGNDANIASSREGTERDNKHDDNDI